MDKGWGQADFAPAKGVEVITTEDLCLEMAAAGALSDDDVSKIFKSLTKTSRTEFDQRVGLSGPSRRKIASRRSNAVRGPPPPRPPPSGTAALPSPRAGQVMDSPTENSTETESAGAARPTYPCGLVRSLISHPQRQVHEIKNQTRMGRESEKGKEEEERTNPEDEEEEGKGRKEEKKGRKNKKGKTRMQTARVSTKQGLPKQPAKETRASSAGGQQGCT